jgi:phage baseplate assembly protein V
MFRFGNITEVDPAKGYARVKFTDDGIVSDMLQIVVMGALQNKFFHTFDINEQVVCFMDENSEEGVILGAVFNNKTAPNGGNKDKVRVVFSDDSFIEYDRASHQYTINVQGDVNITSSGTTTVEAAVVSVGAEMVDVEATTVNVEADSVSVSGDVEVTGNTVITGNLTVSGTISSAISISAPAISGPGVSMLGGNLTASGEISGSTVKAGAIDLATHKHGGVTAGGAQTGAAVP